MKNNCHNYINAMQDMAAEYFGGIFYQSLRSKLDFLHPIIILCIGTDRATGDSLGPITGYKLQSSLAGASGISVFGTLEKPVHAKNIYKTLDEIKTLNSEPLVVAIDACLGKSENVGYLTIGEGPVCPGAGLSKNLPAVGHIAITGIVNISRGMDFAVLQNTRLHLVMKMADVIHEGILLGLKMLEKKDSVIYENIV